MVTRDDELDLIDRLKINIRSRWDPPKESKCEITDLLRKTCNLSLRLVSVLEDWKTANGI